MTDPVTPDREAMVQAVAEALHRQREVVGANDPEAAVDALAPFIAAAEQRGREQAAQAIEADSRAAMRSWEDQSLLIHAARLARGGQT